MRISTVRQLSRALGRLLANMTKNSSDSCDALDQVLEMRPKVGDYPSLLRMTVQAIVDAPDFRSSTPAVVETWMSLAKQHDSKPAVVLIALVAVTRDSCTEMLQDLLAKPAHSFVNQSMDGSIRTTFNDLGHVLADDMKVLKGYFSDSLVRALQRAENNNQQAHGESVITGTRLPALQPEMTTVKLAVERTPWKHDSHTFTLASADFIQAYIAATFEYAAVAYADRVRSGRA